MSSNTEYFVSLDSIVQYVTENRPTPYRKYDQIYMFNEDMKKHVLELKKRVINKDVVFMGDGDGISILLALITKNSDEKPKTITVFDFDERILNAYKKIAENNGIINFHCILYNIIDPLEETCIGKYDYFCINPPYGSKNDGLSCILWLRRSIDVCKSMCSGCIVYPNDSSILWTRHNYNKIVDFIEANGFAVIQFMKNVHQYHLPDNPDLKSSSIFVSKSSSNRTQTWAKEKFSIDEIRNLYGRVRSIPHYILDTGTECGELDMEWN